jgi:glycosyltransferase involved in cell wall biosynthesis
MPNTDVLTDLPAPPGSFWGDHTRFVGPSDPPAWLSRWLGQRCAYNLIRVVNAFRLFARRGACQGVVTGGGANGLLFAWLQGLIPWGRKPHVLIDCNWDLPKGRLWAWLKGLRIRLAARSVHRFVVWASHEVEDYARAFGVPRDRFAYVPFHGTAHNYQYTVRDDGYLFAGGNYDRDYRTLVEAVRPLDVPVWIATTRGDVLLRGVEVPPHVRVEGTTAAGFRQGMAAARLVVVAMEKGLLHSGGQQTLLNAMLMGKPVVAVGRKWAVDFLQDGVNGLIVDYEDVQGLRRAVQSVLGDPGGARRMAERGRAHAAPFTTQRTMQTVHDLVRQAAASCARRPREQERTRHVHATGHPA